MIIGLSGKKNAGKTTVANLLSECLSGHRWQTVMFAQKLKELTALLLGCTLQELEDRNFKESSVNWTGKTPREIMQLMGTDFARNMLGEDVWANALFNQYKFGEQQTQNPGEFTIDYPNWIIGDVRFENEAKSILSRGGVLIRVERRDIDVDLHPSETALDGYPHWNFIIHNNGTMTDLEDTVYDVCKHIKIT